MRLNRRPPITFIKTISSTDADGRLKDIYSRVTGPNGNVDNILEAHSLRPHTLEGHMALYKAVLHNHHNTLPKWYLETIGIFVSLINGCDYCVDHHYAGLQRLLTDDVHTDDILNQLKAATADGLSMSSVLSKREDAGLSYTHKLSRDPAVITADDIEGLRNAGFVDGEILEINQVTAYFSYANRTVLGLGVKSAGDTLGLSPNNNSNEEDWGHR